MLWIILCNFFSFFFFIVLIIFLINWCIRCASKRMSGYLWYVCWYVVELMRLSFLTFSRNLVTFLSLTFACNLDKKFFASQSILWIEKNILRMMKGVHIESSGELIILLLLIYLWLYCFHGSCCDNNWVSIRSPSGYKW